MTVIVPEITPRSSVEKIISPPATEVIANHFEEWKGKRTEETETLANVQQCLNEEATFTAVLKNTPDSISMVFSKKKTQIKNESNMVNTSIFPGSDVKVVSCGRRRSVDKQYKPSQPTNSGGNRGSTRRSGRYQNYDNNSSNGNSGADGNGEDNDDSDDDDDDEYIDEDDDDDEEEEEEEEEEDDEEKNEDEEEDESSIGREKSTSSIDSINEKLLNTLNIKGSEDSPVVLMNSGSSERALAPAPSGTPVTLEGVVCHETMGGVLVVNIKWRNKIYCGSLMDCTRHSWARPRFQSSDSSNQGKTRLGKNNGRGKGKGRGKRLRSNSVTRDNANNHTVSPLKQKLRGRKKTISGSSNDKRTGFRSSKRKAKNNDDDSDDSLRPGKRSCTIKGAPSPQPSPTLIECPEPGCEKKYKHINGLRYHQAHAHLESKNQYDDANSDDRSSTTPSPSDEFKEPDPRITTKAKTTSLSTRNRSESPSSTQDNVTIDNDKDSTNTDSTNDKIKETKNETVTSEEEPTASSHDAVTYQKPIINEAPDEKLKEQLKQESNDSTSNKIPERENSEKKSEIFSEKPINDNSGEGEFVEVADKSTDTRMMNSSESEKGVSYPCEKHSGIIIETVLPASEVPEVADTQEVWETVLDSGCIGNAKYEETGSVNIEDVISSSQREAIEDGGKTDGSDKEMVAKEAEVDERRQIMFTTSSINQLGIEVEDISENEEDIDPGQDTEFNSQEEMEKAVENLQNGSFVASMSTENNLQMLSSLKDPSLIFGLTNREKSEEGTTVDCTRAEDMFSVLPRNKQLSNDDVIQISENMIESELAAATRPLLGVSGEIRDQDENKSYVSELTLTVNSEPELETIEKPVNSLPLSMSVENLVSRSISVSKLQPPLTNTDTPSNRFKYFPCRSYGDETYSQTASNFASTSAVTTLALIRDPEQIRQDTGESKETHEMNVHKDPVESFVENVGPSFTGSAGFDQECITLSIHTRGVKEEHKGNSSTGDIIRSSSNASPGNISADKHHRHESSSKLSYSSAKTSKATTSTTYNFNHYTSKLENPYNCKNNNDEYGYNVSTTNSEWENQSIEPEAPKVHSEHCIDDVKKDDDREKQSSRLFLRQPPTLIPKHNRPMAPTLPVGVAHPYQYNTVATTAAVTTGLSVTSPGHSELCRSEPVCHKTPSKSDPELESKVPTLKKVVTEKAHPIPVGEVGPVAVKRPAIHAGLPTVIPVGAPALKSQGSLHSSIRQGLKPPGQEERSSTPGGLSSRLSSSSPRSLSSSPRPLSTSPRLLSTKTNTSETKSVRSKESLGSSDKPVRDDSMDNDVVIIKEESEPSGDKASAVDAKKMKDRERSSYHASKEQLTPEKIQMYQLQQRQMYQAGIEAIYLQRLGCDIQSFAGPWALNMSPEKMKLIQQHHYRMRAEEDNPREDPNKVRLEKRESISPTERRTATEARTPEQVRSTTPKQERPLLITGATPPGEVSRSSTSEGFNRGMLRLTPNEEPPEKRSRGEYSKSEESEREIKKRRQEEYLYQQSMQHKFTMFKQLENAGGAAKTHSIPPLTSSSKDRHGDRDDDFPKSKYSQRTTHNESLPKIQETSKAKDQTELNSNDLSSRSRESNRDSIRDTHIKLTTKHTWTSSSSSSSRHSDTPPSERSLSVSSSSLTSPFRPTQFQAYLQHNYDPATGNPVLMQTPVGLMQPQMSMDLGGIMNLSSTSVISSSSNTSTSLPSRLKERERFSPYKGINADQSPSSPLSRSSRSSRSHSPSRDSSPIPTSHSKSSHSRNSERTRSPPSHIRTPSSSPSVVSRSSYRSVSPGSHLHRSTERMSNSATVVSRSSHRSSERSLSPSIHGHKESYRVPTSSPSRSSVLSRGERSVSPRSQSHNEYRFKQRSESSSNVLLPESLSKVKAVHDSTRFRGPERHESESTLRPRPGIISNNLAVRRGDVTPSMLMAAAHSQEEMNRRYQYMFYMQQQQEQAAYALMSSKQQNASRSDAYYGKRQ